jgi:hypothetical protein
MAITYALLERPSQNHLSFVNTLLVWVFMVLTGTVFGQTTRTVLDGSWTHSATWSNGLPLPASGTVAFPVHVGNLITIDQSITITEGVYFFGHDGQGKTGKPVEDPSGLPYHTLTLDTKGGYHSSLGIVDIQSGTTNFEGGAVINNTNLVVRSNATLILGPLQCAVCDPDDMRYDAIECAKSAYNNCRQTRLSTGNGTRVTVEPNGKLIVYGNMINTNNTGTMTVNGLVYVVGNYTSDRGNIEVVQEADGEGDIIATGSMTTKGGSTIFGSTIDCPSGPCSGLALGCVLRSEIDPQGIVTACSFDNEPITLDLEGSVTTSQGSIYPYTYVWQKSSTSGTNGWISLGSAVTVTSAPAAAMTYTVNVMETTWYRLAISRPLGGNSGSCTSYSIPVEVRYSQDGWTGNAHDNLWRSAGNWCGGVVPGPDKDVVIPTGAIVLVDAGGGFEAQARSLTLSNGATVRLTESGSVLTIYGNVANNGVLAASSGTVNFRYSAEVAGTAQSVVDGLGTFAFHHLSIPDAEKTLLFPERDVTVTGNIIVGANEKLMPSSTGRIVLDGAGHQVFNGSSNTVPLNLRNILVRKAGGSVTFNTAVRLRGSLDFDPEAVTTVVFQENFILASVDNHTRNDARIGVVPSTVSFTYGLAGSIEAQRFMNAISGKKYRYVAGAVVSTLAPGSNIGSAIYEYNNGWKSQSKSAPLVLGKGYTTMDNGVSTTWSVKGQLHQGDFTWTWSSSSAAGWYLLGNPYAAAIRWSDDGDAWDLGPENNIATTLAVTDNSVAGYPNYFRYYSYNAGHDPGAWGHNELEGEGIVARGQSFWIYKGAGAATLTIKEGAKAGDVSGRFYRQRTDVVLPELAVQLSNGRFTDRAVLTLGAPQRSRTVGGLDKLWNDQAEVYFIEDGRPLLRRTLTALPQDLRIPLGIRVEQVGQYTFSFTHAANFGAGVPLFLIDTKEGVAVPVSGPAYAVTITDVSRPVEDRFYLSTSAEVPERTLTKLVRVYPNPVVEKLIVEVPEGQVAWVHVLDSSGRVVAMDDIQGEGVVAFGGMERGIYLVRVMTIEGTVVERVVKE